MRDPIFFAPLRVPLVDDRTGLMSREWILFFQAMYLRIGGIQAFSVDDLQLVGDVNDAIDDGSDVRAATADLERALGLIDEPQASVAADLAELQALSASFSEDPIIARFTAQWDGLTPASGGGALKFLRADGAWVVPAYPAVPVGANPSASVGLAAVNGSAATFMRSDAAPSLDQTITPTWTNPHTFSSRVTFSADALFSGVGAIPSIGTTQVLIRGGNSADIEQVNSGGAADSKIWSTYADATTLHFRLVTDSFSASRDWLAVLRSGLAVSSVSVGNTTDNQAFNVLGTGLATFNGDVKTVGKSGFNNTAPIAKPAVIGSRGANAALASLLTFLASYGLITDSTTP